MPTQECPLMMSGVVPCSDLTGSTSGGKRAGGE